METGGFVGAMVFLYLVAFLLIVLWIVLPFAVFGVKGLLRELIREQRKTNDLLARTSSSGVDAHGRS